MARVTTGTSRGKAAARAAKRGDSPAKQLSAWLARVWGEQREDAAEDGVEPQAELLSFLDDEGLPAAGTGTQRSLAATAAVLHGLAGERASGGGPFTILDLCAQLPAVIAGVLRG